MKHFREFLAQRISVNEFSTHAAVLPVYCHLQVKVGVVRASATLSLSPLDRI
jgi:hypothetical protein